MKKYEATALMQLVKARKIDHGVCGEINNHNNEEAFHIILFTDPSRNIWNHPKKRPPKPKTVGSQNVNIDVNLLLGLELKVLDQKYSGDIFKLQSNS
jgi:hypothetical protein